MRTHLLILALLITTPTLAGSRPQLRHQRHQSAKPATSPNLGQVYANGATHGLVFRSVGSLTVYAHDTVSVGNPTPLSMFIDSGAATFVPNGTRLSILSPVVVIHGIGASYVKIRMESGYWVGKIGYILWEEVAALPTEPKGKSVSRRDGKPSPAH